MTSRDAYTDADLQVAEQAVREHGDWSAKWSPEAPLCIADDILTAVAPAIAARPLRELADRLEGVFAEVLVEMIRARADEIETER